MKRIRLAVALIGLVFLATLAVPEAGMMPESVVPQEVGFWGWLFGDPLATRPRSKAGGDSHSTRPRSRGGRAGGDG
jgi:hypothetical protein